MLLIISSLLLFLLSGADSATHAEAIAAGNAGRSVAQPSDKSHDIVRDDSRYTGASGSNRKSYITRFRGGGDSSRDSLGSRMSDLATNDMARSFSARRSKLDDTWRLLESRTTRDSADLLRIGGASGEISNVGAVRYASDPDGSSLRLSEGRKGFRDEVGAVGSVLASNTDSDSGVGRTSYHMQAATENFTSRFRPNVSSNGNVRLIPRTRHSSVKNDFFAIRPSDFERTNVTSVTSPDDVSVVGKSKEQNSDSINSFSNKDNDVSGSMSRTDQSLYISSSQAARMNIHGNRGIGAMTNSVRRNHEIADGTAANLKPWIVIDPSRRPASARRDSLNNSGKATRVIETRPSLIQNSKSDVAHVSRRVAASRGTSHRNFVRLRRPVFTAANRPGQVVKYVEDPSSYRRNASDVAPDTKERSKLRRKSDDVRRAGVVRTTGSNAERQVLRTTVKRPESNGRHEPAPRNRHSSYAQKLPSQTDRIDDGDKTRNATAVRDAYLKNWPNGALQNIEDLYNYEKYTSSLVESGQGAGFQNAGQASFLPPSDGYIDQTDPILDSSVKKIIHWLKIPEIVSNSTHFVGQDVNKPVESVLESIYGSLQPNRPLNAVAQNSDYGTVVLQGSSHEQYLDKIDYHGNYPNHRPNPSLHLRPQHPTTIPAYPAGALIPSEWSDVTSLTNNTPPHGLATTHVTQNTVVHILNESGPKNATQLAAVAPVVTDQTVSTSNFSSGSAQKPNVQTGEEEPARQEISTSPSSSDKPSCPTITINSYTRLNNTIQSKEGCTDLNIVINSHILNTNVFKPSAEPIADQQVPTQNYGDASESDKYAGDDLPQQDSSVGYVTASSGAYGPYEQVPTYSVSQSDYHQDSQKDPGVIPGQEYDPSVHPALSSVEVFQDTQISVSGSYDPLTDAETGQPPLVGTDGSPAGSSVDGAAVGDDASNSAGDPPTGDVTGGASASGTPAAGDPSSANFVQGLPALQSPGTVMGQANDALIPGTLQLPQAPSLPALPNAPGKPGSPGSSSSHDSSVGSTSSQGDEDDDDDDFDMSPGGVLHSVASVFTYFTFLNPLGYSFFSLTAAPFAAMAAGVLGVAAFVFPWAFPSVFDLGRSADRMTIRFRPNVEEFVRQAVRKYDRLNEWKSRRRKRRR